VVVLAPGSLVQMVDLVVAAATPEGGMEVARFELLEFRAW
jgi:hypothetical protein